MGGLVYTAKAELMPAMSACDNILSAMLLVASQLNIDGSWPHTIPLVKRCEMMPCIKPNATPWSSSRPTGSVIQQYVGLRANWADPGASGHSSQGRVQAGEVEDKRTRLTAQQLISIGIAATHSAVGVVVVKQVHPSIIIIGICRQPSQGGQSENTEAGYKPLAGVLWPGERSFQCLHDCLQG